MNSSQTLHAHSFQLPPLQDLPQEEPATDPSVDQDNEANEAESSARASSVPIDSVSEEEEEEKRKKVTKCKIAQTQIK